MDDNSPTTTEISYDINIAIVNIIQNILNQQIPSLLDNISVKENIDRNSLNKCVKKLELLKTNKDSAH
jgi:predicted transcriptional regulator